MRDGHERGQLGVEGSALGETLVLEEQEPWFGPGDGEISLGEPASGPLSAFQHDEVDVEGPEEAATQIRASVLYGRDVAIELRLRGAPANVEEIA